jgi:hypothetical protein
VQQAVQDGDLAEIIRAWPALRAEARAEIMAIAARK